MSDLLALDFMRQALVAALLAGFAAPLVGVFLVQRRMSLIGDGMGHVALAGVAIGVLTGQEPVFTALIAAVLAAIAIELIRASGRTSGDTALAVMFYGGIALGVVFGVLLSLNLEVIVKWVETTFGVSFLSPDVYYISELPSDLHWRDVGWITVTAFVFCIFATLYPAWRAARIEPAAALRHE